MVKRSALKRFQNLQLRSPDISDLPFYNPYSNPAVGDGGAAAAAGGGGTVNAIGPAQAAGPNNVTTPDPSDPSSASGSSSTIDPGQLAMNIDIALLVIVLVLAFFSIPKVVARFRRASAWRYGFMFRSAVERKVRPETRISMISKEKSEPIALNAGGFLSPRPFGPEGTISHARTRSWASVRKEAPEFRGSFQHPGSMQFMPPTSQHHRATDPNDLPPHARTYTSMFDVVASALEYRLVPRFSLGQSIVLTIYTIIIAWASLVGSNIFTDENRTGYLAMSQIPVVVALATKNNIIGGLLGQGYERLNYIHRYMGRILVILANIHALHHRKSYYFFSLYNSDAI